MSAAKELAREEHGYSQAMRVFAVIEAIAPSTNGLPIKDIHARVNEITGDEWNRRTIVRDLSFLQSRGYCSMIKVKHLRLYVINRNDGKFPTYLFPI